MSDLQLALIVLGAIIIGGVLAYNWLQEKKLRKQVNNDFIVPQKDVLTDDFHINADAYVIDKDLAEVKQKTEQKSKQFMQHTVPNAELNESELAPATQTNKLAQNYTAENYPANNFAAQQILAAADEAANVESALAAADFTDADLAEEADIETVKVAVKPAPEPIVKAVLHDKIQAAEVNLPESAHSQIDLTAILYASKSIKNDDLNTLKQALSQIALPSSLYGLSSSENSEQGKWLAITENSNSSFKQLACSLQLADRGGPVAKNVLNKFQFAVEDAGLAMNAHVEWQGSGDAMQRAITLDQFCIEVDQMISVHLAQGESAIHGTKFKGLAEANGMALKEDGKFYYHANESALFSAIDTNNVPFTAESLRNNVLKSITFQIEIPKVNNCEQVFNQMILMAQKMAASLGATLVDDNQKPLGDLQIEKIRQQLKVIHATMVARGIMPGSPASMRLFN